MWQRIALLVVTFGTALLLSAQANGELLHDLHEKAGVPCAACHQETPAAVAPPDTTCVACHGTMLEGESTTSPDPHRSPHLGPGEAPACSECHHIHRPSEVTCTMCHRRFQFDIK